MRRNTSAKSTRQRPSKVAHIKLCPTSASKHPAALCAAARAQRPEMRSSSPARSRSPARPRAAAMPACAVMARSVRSAARLPEALCLQRILARPPRPRAAVHAKLVSAPSVCSPGPRHGCALPPGCLQTALAALRLLRLLVRWDRRKQPLVGSTAGGTRDGAAACKAACIADGLALRTWTCGT